MEKGTFRGHLRAMLRALFLWTSFIKIEKFKETLEKELCFTYDNLILSVTDKNNESISCSLIFDFGDIKLEYKVLFKVSPTTKKWVLYSID